MSYDYYDNLGGALLFQRVNRLAIDLPNVEYGDANAASAVQELLGGKFGEMSTLNNYMYQSFNFRGKKIKTILRFSSKYYG